MLSDTEERWDACSCILMLLNKFLAPQFLGTRFGPGGNRLQHQLFSYMARCVNKACISPVNAQDVNI